MPGVCNFGFKSSPRSVSLHTILLVVVGLSLTVGSTASADMGTLALAADDCGSATTQLQSAEIAYRNAQKQLSQAQQTCKGDFNCIYPYQTALSRAQATLEAARDTVDKACK